MENIKVVSVGDVLTGKTCLLISYTTNTFPTEYIPALMDPCTTNIMMDGTPVCLELWDTTGHSGECAEYRPRCYPGTDVFLLCYSVSCMESLKNIKTKWVPEVRTLLG